MKRINLLFAFLAATLLSVLLLVVMWPGLHEPILEGLDGAHHLMDGLFFYDLLQDRPFANLSEYTFNYYRQYPALGFIFWPPLFPLIEGIFFHLMGTQMQSALGALAVFGVVLTASVGWLAKRLLVSDLWAWLATALLMTASVLLPYWNTVMREIPVLAMMLLWLVCWYRWLEQATTARMLTMVVVGWLVIYTKQTGALIFIVAAIDLLLIRRSVMKRPSIWCAVALFILGALPLLIWTLTYGSVNLAQSFGGNTQRIMAAYQAIPRWSWSAWWFYLPVMMGMIPKLLWPGLLLSAMQLRNRTYWLWFLWIVCFYLLFSYFDNRADRFAILVLSPLVFLSVVGWCWVVQRFQWLHWPVMAILVCALGQQIAVAVDYVPRGERGLSRIVSSLHLDDGSGGAVHDNSGNTAYFGIYRNLWVYHQRMQDPMRRRAVLKGEALLALNASWSTLLYDYQIAYLVIEAPLNAADIKTPLTNGSFTLEKGLLGMVKRLPDAEFTLDNQVIKLQIWQYIGPKAVNMSQIPLNAHLTDQE